MFTKEHILERLREALRTTPQELRAVTRAMKSFLEAERATLIQMHSQGEKGTKICAAFAHLADAVVEFAFEFACEKGGARTGDLPPLCLVALGGYGRGFLNPHSDVDILILHPEDAHLEEERRLPLLTHLLWDLGFQVGQSCRTVEHCRAAMRESLKTASSFFDARLIAGDPGLFQSLRRRAIADYLATQKRAFAEACLNATRARYAEWKDSPLGLEPNVKESPGGLRDAQVISWLQRIQGDAPLRTYHFVAAAWSEPLRQAHDFILRARTALHLVAGRANDLLDLRTQPLVAEALGYRESGGFSPVELFMRDYYRSASTIWRELRFQMQRIENSVLGGTISLRGRWRRWLGDGLVSIGGRIYIADPQFFAGSDAPKRLMRLFLISQNTRRPISQDALREIRTNLSIVDDSFRTDREVARLFLELFGGQGNVADILRVMHECGLLDEYIPEFGALNCLVWYRNYHDFTVDEHSLNAVAVLDELRTSPRKEDAFKRNILLQTEQPGLLALAALLHDIGKSVAGDHSENGATMIPAIAERLCLTETDTKRLYFLVANHLLMIHTAQAHDLRERSVIEDFATTVGTLADLQALYLLSYADTKAVGRAAWTQWQDALLQELYECTVRHLSGAPVQQRTGSLLERMTPLLSTPNQLKAAQEHCALVPERYRVEVTPEEAVEHLTMLENLHRGEAPLVVSVRVERDSTSLWVCTTDRPARFSQLAGALSGCGVDIVSAQAYTRKDGIIFDHFHVVDIHGKVVSDPEFQKKVAENMKAVLIGRVDVQDLIRHQQRRVAFKRVIPQPGATRIIIENKSSPYYTVIDVGTWDRIGLLYAISSTISALGLDIHFAKISTKANRATDVFYVTDKNTGQKILNPHRQHTIQRRLYETCETFGM